MFTSMEGGRGQTPVHTRTRGHEARLPHAPASSSRAAGRCLWELAGSGRPRRLPACWAGGGQASGSRLGRRPRAPPHVPCQHRGRGDGRWAHGRPPAQPGPDAPHSRDFMLKWPQSGHTGQGRGADPGGRGRDTRTAPDGSLEPTSLWRKPPGQKTWQTDSLSPESHPMEGPRAPRSPQAPGRTSPGLCPQAPAASRSLSSVCWSMVTPAPWR